MFRIRLIGGLAVPLMMSAVVGCGSGTPPPGAPAGSADVAPAGPTPSDEDDEPMAELKEHHRHHHHGGFAMFVEMSLDSLGTTPDQQAAITKIQSDLRAKMQPAHDAEKVVLSTLAAGVAAGAIDPAKVDAAIAQLSAAAAGVHDAVVDSLNQLHATLTPPQRLALVQKVEAHFHVWRDANSEDEPVTRDTRGGHLGALAKELGLAPDQVEKIRANFKASMGSLPAHYDSTEGEAQARAFASAFTSDTFDARTLTAAGAANAHIAVWGATRMAHFYEAAAPALTPDQRLKLADLLHRHAYYTQPQPGT